MFCDKLNELQKTLGNKLDSDDSQCMSDGFFELMAYIRKNCKTIEQYQALFKIRKVIPL